ncbi:hypothetical protein QYM36_004647 [Artemia franciscana]|uniref:Uncharacterized protein n=1 Tax=Artemia franciscana TaxID=6661 RepID=A0AA88L8C8_ARTSF|nr:hypothetical protein QYM36_004647 [Artemia franciscana]
MSHGIADVERDSYESGRIMTEEKSSMEVKMLYARLIVFDALKKFENRLMLYETRFLVKNHQGQTKYPLVSKIVKAALCMSHGIADVERDSYESGRIMTEEKSSMEVKMLYARLIVSDALKKFENSPYYQKGVEVGAKCIPELETVPKS